MLTLNLPTQMTSEPVRHPLVEEMFTRCDNGYQARDDKNHH